MKKERGGRDGKEEERREGRRKKRVDERKRDFTGGPVVKTVLPMQGTWV